MSSLDLRGLKVVEVNKSDDKIDKHQKVELGELIIKELWLDTNRINSYQYKELCLVIANTVLDKIHELRNKTWLEDITSQPSPNIEPEKEKQADETPLEKANKAIDFESMELKRKASIALLEIGVEKESPRPTPNCSICQWNKREPARKPIMGPPQPPKNQCSAQGDRYITNVYGNKICKRLFVESEPPTNKEENKHILDSPDLAI